VNARDLLVLIANRHLKDVFVPECKNGPTHYTEHRRLDAWAMDRSWAHPCFTGYEIKISRSDWLKDQKVTDYLALCNRLWIVAPVGILQPEELPEGVGWLAPASTGSMLLTKRKAVHREIDPPVSLLLYVLMCRAKIGAEYARTREERADRWRRNIEEDRALDVLGHSVSKRLRAETVERVEAAELRARLAEERAGRLENVDAVLRELDVTPERLWGIRAQVERAIDPLHEARVSLEAAVRAIARVETRTESMGATGSGTNGHARETV
jgi:hypothetical protein